MNNPTYPHINWTDGMKLNKAIFIANDNANIKNLHSYISSTLSPVKYGLLPAENNFDIQTSIDNQNILRINIASCKAITIGGVLIDIKNIDTNENTDGNPSITVDAPRGDSKIYWISLTVQPFDRIPYGQISSTENPPRFPYVKQGYNIEVVADHDYDQYTRNPYSLTIGKLISAGDHFKVDAEYLPPCLSTNASEDLIGLHSELDSFLSGLELACSQIVQKIYKKSQQNELAELAQFCCDRLIIHLSDTITAFRWQYLYESPVKMLGAIAALARVLKNTIDLRTGSGKEELMNYLSEWCELKQGELENLLTAMALLRYNHNDINENIKTVIQFAKTAGKLFNTLSNLEFIGKRKEAGIFVKEGYINDDVQNGVKPKRRFFGG